jgi:hypothetical protein
MENLEQKVLTEGVEVPLVDIPPDVNTNPQVTLNDANNAAKFFKDNIHVFREKLMDLNKRSLEKVVTNLVGFPLYVKPLANKRESDAYHLGTMLMDAKSIMIMYSAEHKAAENEVNETEKKENV